MKWVKSAWRNVKTPNPEVEISDRVFRTMTAALALLFLISASSFALQGMYLFALLYLGTFVLTLIAMQLYRKTASSALAGSLVLIFSAPSAFYRASEMGGPHSPALLLFPLIPVLTLTIMPASWATFWSALYVAMTLYFFLAERFGINFTAAVDPGSLDAVRALVAVVVQVLLFGLMYFIKSTNRAYRRQMTQREREKANLLRVLSHDLATPLMILRYNTDAIAKRLGESGETRKLRDTILVIQDLISDVRELEAVNSGKKDLCLKPVSLVWASREVLDAQQELARSKGVALRLRDDNGPDSYNILAEPRSLTFQVINNLVSNAVKFTRPGGEVSIRLARDGGRVTFEISDTGIGMEPQLVNRLFDNAYATSRPGTAGEKGTGFGMSIIKSYVERLGGEIEVESIAEPAPGHGTRIRLSFPALQGM